MSIPIPDLANPWRLVRTRSCFAGLQRRDSLARLADAVREIASDLDYHLRFGLDEAGRARIEGRVQIRVALICQRCLGTLVLDLDSAFQLAPVATEAEADLLPDELDVVVLPEQPMRVLDLLEDELLLSLPTVPTHAPGACGTPEPMVSAGPVADALGDSDHSFAVLAALKHDLNKT